MNRLILLLLCSITLLTGSGALYFLSLVLHVPFAVFGIAMMGLGYGCYHLYKSLLTAEILPPKVPLIPALLMLMGVVKILWSSSKFYQPLGGWDALAMWNYHARFLSDPQHWERLYKTRSYDHIDYPHGLPAMIAILWRLGKTPTPIIPLIFSWWAAVAIPLLIFCAVTRRNSIIALISLIYFCCSESYLRNGISGYADTLLSLVFLGTMLASDEYRRTGNPYWLALCGACAGAMIWTKNEGLMITVIFLLFNAGLFLKQKNAAAFIFGAVLPVSAYLAHKIGYAPANDLVSSTHASSLKLLTDGGRFTIILKFFRELMWEWFRPVIFFVAAYALWCVLRKRWPSRNILFVITCFAGYIVVYMITPYSLEWHLSTSMDRLIHQLVPPLFYGIAMHLTTTKRTVVNAGSLAW